MHLALGSCWRDKHYLHVHAYRQEECCCYTAVGEKKISCSKRNECDWNCPNAHTCPLGTSPVSPLEKKTGGGDDLLWICATKASMENRIWLFAVRAVALSTYPLVWPYWERTWDFLCQWNAWLLLAAFFPILRDYLPLYPALGSNAYRDDASRRPPCQWPGIGNSAVPCRILLWSFLPQKIRLNWGLTLSRARIKHFSNKIFLQNIYKYHSQSFLWAP